ncbi:MAG: hypothetical protein JSS84_08465 [Bacteroidetes bacterium]|nr:hypothetical protein [Bacteroidota bacterium]
MTTILTPTTTRKQLAALLKRTRKRKRRGVDVKSFSGTISLNEDPMVIQRRMRDEWK